MTNILLTTTVSWPSAARYARGFSVAGCAVHALSPARAPVIASRYTDRHHLYNPLFPLSSLCEAITLSGADLIVPCDDRAVLQLLQVYDTAKAKQGSDGALAAVIRLSLGTPENYAGLMSRAGSLAAIREAGVRVPDIFEVAHEEDLDERLALIGFPAVVKADGSWGGDGVVIARDRDEAHIAYRRLACPPSRLRSLARVMRRRDPHFLKSAIFPRAVPVSVQRFVTGLPAASAIAAWKGEIKASIYYDVLVAQGTIGPPSVIRRVDCPDIDKATRIVARLFGLSGLHGIDFIRDAQGAVHLIEVNPRATQGGTLPFGRGRDLPGALAACVMTQEPALREAITSDIVAFFPREWQRDPASPYLDSAHHDVPWDDPDVLLAALNP